MNKLIFTVFLFLFVLITGISGQTIMDPYWLYDSHYLIDKCIINPAFSGKQYDPKVFVSTQRMEITMRDAPAVHLAGAHARFMIGRDRSNKFNSGYRDIRNAISGLVFADYNGPFQSIGFKLDYAYIVPINRKGSTLSFGLGGMLFSKRLNLDKYVATSLDDPLIAACTGNHIMVPDVNTGILLSHGQLYVGLSVSQLLENSFQFSELNYTSAQIYRNFYLLSGYRLVYKDFEFEPSLAAGYNFDPWNNFNNGKFVDINLEFYLKPAVFTLSYRINGFVATSFQYRVQNLELGLQVELFSTNRSDARLSGVGVMASYTFLSDKTVR